jgi:hypothetical protein
MSTLKVNSITGKTGNTPVFTRGVFISTPSDPTGISTLTVSTVNVTGVATASFFVGDGSAMTNLGGVTPAKGFALTSIT